MKTKLRLCVIFTLFVCLLGLVGCATVSNTNNETEADTIQNDTQVNVSNSFNQKPQKNVHKEPVTIYEMWVEAKALQQKAEDGSLLSEEANRWISLKDKYSAGDGEYRHKLTGKKVSMADVVTIGWAVEKKFTWEEIDWVLDLGIYQDNPYCDKDGVVSLKIFRTLAENSALVLGCKDGYDLGSCDLDKIQIYLYVSPNEEELLYDQKTIKIKSGECAMIVGTATYITSDNISKTVPIILPIEKRIHKARLATIEDMRKKFKHIDLTNNGSQKKK